MASSIDAIPTEALETLLECSVCLETLNDPRTLSCFHSFCRCCLEKFVQGCRNRNENPQLNTFECPICRSEFTVNPQKGVEGIGANYFVRNMLDIMAVESRVKGVPCHQCQKASAGRCVHSKCQCFLCEGCIQAHNNYLGNQDHSVLSMDELSKPENRSKIRGNPRCKEHEGEILKFFCETCEELICQDCKVDNHEDHKCSSLKKAAEQRSEALKKWCAKLSDKLNESDEALQAMNNVVKVLDDNVKAAKDKIRERKNGILAAVSRMLEEKETSLTDKIDAMYRVKSETINKQLGEGQVYVNKVKNSMDLCKNLLENGDAVEIVSSHRVVVKNIEKTEKYNPGDWKPVNDGSIPFNQSSMEAMDIEIVKLSERLGEIEDNSHCRTESFDTTKKSCKLVTGRIPLAKSQSIEAELKEACAAEGATDNKAADSFLVTGTLSESSSSEHNEKSALPSSKGQHDTQPYLATYIQAFHNEDLKKIEQCYNVVITWALDGSKVQIAASSTSGTKNHSKLACDEFMKIYKKSLCSVSQYVPGLVVEKVDDGKTYNLWGTHTSLENGQEWVRKQLGISSSSPKTKSLPPRTGQDKLTHETPSKLKVVVYEGDITQENSDIIVNACNKHLDHRKGVSFAISKAGGPSVQQESDQYVKKHGLLSTGDVVVTGSGFLKCKKILHAVGPQWKKQKKDGSITFLKNVFWKIYNIALSLKAKSVAIPAISSGVYGVPKEVCAQTTFSFINELDENLASKKTGPFEIRLVNIDPETVKVFRQEFHKWLLKGDKVKQSTLN